MATTSNESGSDYHDHAASSGWTTTKQAAKVLGVSRRSVQSYVHRGLLEAKSEGEEANKTFLISINSLNALRDRRKREAKKAANFAEGSPGVGDTANLAANTGEGWRHVIDRLEARTAEATKLRSRLELTEQAESTLRQELEEERQRREEAERERDELRRWQESVQESRESPETLSRARETEESQTAEGAPQQPTTPLSKRTVVLWVIGACLALVFAAVVAFVVTTLLLT